MPQPRHALILTAGLGTRLQPLTSVRAKPAIPVAGKPMIRRIIAWLSANGVTEIVLNLHHLPHTLTQVVGDGRDLSANVRYTWEPVVLGSAGGPRRALPILGADTFYIVNGDTLSDVGLHALAEAHAASGALVTMALVPNREPQRYGGVALDERGRVVGFRRRPSTSSGQAASAEGTYHFVGVQIAHADAFRALPDGQPVNSVGGVYDDLIAKRPGAIAGYVSDAAFWDVGTASDYWRTSLEWAASECGGALRPGPGTRIDPTAKVTRSILWSDVEIGPDCRLDDCIVADGVRLPRGASYSKQILVRSGDDGVTATPFERQT